MGRASSCIFVLALLVAPAAASAQPCMCVLAQPNWDGPSWDGIVEAPPSLGPESVELGPLFSSDGTALTSRIVELEAARTPRAPSEVLWCASADDPRCSGGDVPPERGPSTGEASHGAAGDVEGRPRIGRPGDGDAVALTDSGGPRSGVTRELERPPRR